MSRFEEVVNEVIGEVVLGEATFKAEALATRIAELVRERQDAARAEVTVAARYPEHKPAPVSGIPTQEIYTLYGVAVASAAGTRRLVGVAAQGLTACPCAQQLVMGASRERLLDDGFSEDEVGRIFEHVPVATHNQRGLGTLHIGMPESCTKEIDARTLLDIVEGSMSSEIYELMKRSDEGAVVEKAHRRPRFVEDCVREMIGGVVDAARRPRATRTSSARARRTSRRSTSTTSSPSASACSASCATSSRRASTRCITSRCATGSTPPGADRRGALRHRRLRLRGGRGARRLAPLLGLAQHAAQPEEVVHAADDRDRDRAVDEPVDPRR